MPYARNRDRDFEARNGVPDEAERRYPPAPASRLANQIPPAELRWLWQQRLPFASVTLLVGDPGVGKSLLTADIAARITRGDSWPSAPGRPPLPSDFPHVASVVHAATQDAVDSIILSRLTAARADLECVAFLDGARLNAGFMMMMQQELDMGVRTPDRMPEPVDRPIRLPDDEATLERSLREYYHTHCLIIDPITDYISPGVSITELFRSLTAIARRQNVVILATAHLSKTPTHRPIYRVRGSLEYVSAARSVLLLAADSTDPRRRILHQIKSSYGPLAPTLAFHIVDPDPEPPAPLPGSPEYEALSYQEKMELHPLTRKPRLPRSPHIAWDDNPAPCLPPELLDISRERQCALHEASQWLTRALESGPRPAHELRREAAQIGIADRTLYRAKLALNIASGHRPEFQKWSWWSILPESVAPPS